CESALSAIPNAFSARKGGILCPLCRPRDIGSLPLSVNAQKYLRMLDRKGLATTMRLPADDALKREVDSALSGYLRHVCERNLKSLDVWSALRDAAPLTELGGA
ncbi:MAG: DNA repair protein RecO C-terminal domain-containing protein, partial [Chloroflexota bacterium]|nr:DNA repair protein RecO C-terminal domain-containing protein [Chloroflexota bacterium]